MFSFACRITNGRACIFDDDFEALAPLLESSDLIVIATPLYWFSFPAKLKAALDKMFAFLVGERPMGVRESILLACGETTEMADFARLVKSYELISDYLEWTDLGRFLVPAVEKVTDIQSTDALQRAEDMGAAIC